MKLGFCGFSETFDGTKTFTFRNGNLTKIKFRQNFCNGIANDLKSSFQFWKIILSPKNKLKTKNLTSAGAILIAKQFNANWLSGRNV